MDYTLFVDESGNFRDNRREWIVSGVLVAGSPGKAEAVVRKRIASALQSVGIDSPRQAHLGPVRKQSMSAAQKAARTLFAGLASGEETVRVGAVRNRTAVRVGSRKPMTGTYEQSYRLMLLDLLALLEATLPADEPLGTLSLVVARRWRKGDREPMTSHGDLLVDVIDRLPDAIEAGLASRGLLASTTEKSLDIQQAEHRWGLAAADFVANTVRNEKTDADIIRAYAGPPLRWRTFTAFGTYEQRRARVAERDRDLPGALARWALLEATTAEEHHEQNAALERIWGDVLQDPDPYGPRAVLETVLERLRKEAEAKPARLSAALQRLGTALDSHTDLRLPSLQFRFRIFARTTAHTHGDVALGDAYGAQQHEARDLMLQAPESLSLVFDSDLADVTAHHYRLQFADALEAAERYTRLVATYGEAWSRLDALGGADAFAHSRLALRAQSVLATARLLAGGVLGSSLIQESAEGFARLTPVLPHDVSRNRNNHMAALSKLGKHAEALDLARTALAQPKPDAHDQFNALRVAANAALTAGRLTPSVREVYEYAVALGHDGPGNPYHLSWREIGLLRQIDGADARRVADAYQLAENKTHDLAPTPIRRWLLWVLAIHRGEATGQPVSVPSDGADVPAEAREIVAAVARRADAEGVLRAVRFVSPY